MNHSRHQPYDTRRPTANHPEHAQARAQHMLPRLFGYTPLQLPGTAWMARVLGTVVFAYGGWPFLQRAVREIEDRVPGMMKLIALAITVAFVFSAAVMLGFLGMPLREQLATPVGVMLLRHWLEM